MSLLINRHRHCAMKTNEAVLRDVIGFVGGGAAAAVVAAVILRQLLPLPVEPRRGDHTGEALAILVASVFFCGGFIGRRAFSADSWSELLPSVITSYAVLLLLCVTASLDFRETGTMLVFASAGMVTSGVLMALPGRRFPLQSETTDA